MICLQSVIRKKKKTNSKGTFLFWVLVGIWGGGGGVRTRKTLGGGERQLLFG